MTYSELTTVQWSTKLKLYSVIFWQILEFAYLTLRAHAREVTVIALSVTVCVSLFDFGEGALFRVETQYIIGDDLSHLNIENRSYFGEKASGTSAVTAVIYVGTAQSLNNLARDLFARGTLYQSCHSCSVSSLRVVACSDCSPFCNNSELVY